jgi:hypothetical protein
MRGPSVSRILFFRVCSSASVPALVAHVMLAPITVRKSTFLINRRREGGKTPVLNEPIADSSGKLGGFRS